MTNKRYVFGGWSNPLGELGEGVRPERYIIRRHIGYKYRVIDTTKDGAEAIIQKGLTKSEAEAWLRLLRED